MSSQTYRILAVDDAADNLFLLQTILEAEGYAVDVATSGQLALSKIQAAPPDLILLDVMMPEMSGYEVARRIRQQDKLPSIPILLISAHDEPSAVHLVEIGANDFIAKPLDFEELLSRVRAFLKLERKLHGESAAVDTEPAADASQPPFS